MNDAGAMDRFQSVQRLDGELHRVTRRKRSARADSLREILALDVLPDHVMRPVRQRGEVVQRGHVWILDLRRRTRLTQEPLMCIRAFGDLRTDHFDHARRAEECVHDFVDLAHAAGAKSLDDLVLAVDGLIGIAAQKLGDRLAAMRTGFEISIDDRLAADAVRGGHERRT